MIVVRVKSEVDDDEHRRLAVHWERHGHRAVTCRVGRWTLVALPDTTPLPDPATAHLVALLRSNPTVVDVVDATDAPPLVSRCATGEDTGVPVAADRVIGGGGFSLIAGPCAVEGGEQLMGLARDLAARGAGLLRGGVYKPRTSPYAFQGLGSDGLTMLRAASAATGLPVVTEVLDAAHVAAVAEQADMLQVGSRNGQNFALLKEVALTGLPVLLKRGFGCTVDEWLHSAEYVLAAGNSGVVLCERGIRTFESATRFTLDISAVPLVKRLSHLPVIVDPSHACGRRDLIIPLAAAAAAAGADGVMVDVHPCGPAALCDGAQALSPAEFGSLVTRVGQVLGRDPQRHDTPRHDTEPARRGGRLSVVNSAV
ncbi:3-deoxy-7-phosphoheptulonate synthase [Solihabitans fulvus]|uniref:3-deoxy-7-phosphoheptulonate synthase n=1 Tax=Solihabitans fulvus TaxID=1892852 RepID=A0A5B2WJ07_9PSEU|nr:3-deoxy-7-phosphoheptulonate synthase [Solihabitans fulvus]KAA2251395.1 3-deoxy-7-phosphoheptulonate synthase [Solihabitans fulvus]